VSALIARLSRLSPPAFWLLAAVVVGALAAESWILVLRQPFNAYRELAAAKESLRAIEQMTVAQEEELRRAEARSKQLAERLDAELQPPAPEEQLTVSLMRQLDQAAGRAGITLTSLKPAGRRNVLAFEEISFDVGAQGKYLPLCHWLLNFEQSLGRSATVTDFTMRSVDEGRQVQMTLKLALYRPRPA
jgi:Tfp pilus assembly protein PilO